LVPSTYSVELPPALEVLRGCLEVAQHAAVSAELVGEAEGMVTVAERIITGLREAAQRGDSQRAEQQLVEQKQALSRERERQVQEAETDVKRLQSQLEALRSEREHGAADRGEDVDDCEADELQCQRALATAQLRALRFHRLCRGATADDCDAHGDAGGNSHSSINDEDITAVQLRLQDAHAFAAADEGSSDTMQTEINLARKWLAGAVKLQWQGLSTKEAARWRQHEAVIIEHQLASAGEVADALAFDPASGQMAVPGSSEGSSESATLLLPPHLAKSSSSTPLQRTFRPSTVSSVLCVAVSEAHVAMGLATGSISVYGCLDGAEASECQLNAHADAVLGMAIDGDLLISSAGDADATVQQWSLAARRSRAPPKQGHVKAITSVCMTSGCIVSGSNDHTARVWWRDGHPDVPVHVLKHQGDVNSVRADGDLIVTACSDWCVHVWSLATGKRTHRLEGHTRPVWSVALHHGVLISGADGADSSVRVWSLLENGRASHHKLQAPGSGGVLGLVASNSNDTEGFLAALFFDGTLCVWRRLGLPGAFS